MEVNNVMETVGPIVATAEPTSPEALLAGLDRRISEIESALANLSSVRAGGEHAAAGRKTQPGAQVSVLAKGSADETNSASVDDALRTLSMEQRFAVKSGLIRAGLLR